MPDVQRYLRLITSQHADKPDFIDWLTAALNIPDGIAQLNDEFDEHFNIDTAIGNQLDIIGDIVGRMRKLTFQPTLPADSPIMDDETYRLAIKAKIAQNMWDGTMASIYSAWDILFPTVRMAVIDNQDMSMSVLVVGLTSQLQKDLVSNGYIVPKPAGVRINYAFPDGLVFAYDRDNDVFTGYDLGNWLQWI